MRSSQVAPAIAMATSSPPSQLQTMVRTQRSTPLVRTASPLTRTQAMTPAINASAEISQCAIVP